MGVKPLVRTCLTWGPVVFIQVIEVRWWEAGRVEFRYLRSTDAQGNTM